MRYAVLVARLHGQTRFQAEVMEVAQANELYKKTVTEAPPELAELHLLMSDQGVIKKKVFRQEAMAEPEPAAEPEPSPEPELADDIDPPAAHVPAAPPKQPKSPRGSPA